MFATRGIIEETKMPGGAINTPGAIDLMRRPTMSSLPKNPPKEKTFIYALKDPRDGSIRYVGKSNTPKQRLQQHIADRTTNRQKTAWIRSLRLCGLEPELEILEEVPAEYWPEAECHWIDLGCSRGWPLTNIAAGGLGGYGGAIRDDEWDELLFSYMPVDEWNLFCGLDVQRKKTIGRLVVLHMMEECWVAIKARGGDPRKEFSKDAQYWRGSDMARQLVAADEAHFEEISAQIESTADETVYKMKAFLNATYGVGD